MNTEENKQKNTAEFYKQVREQTERLCQPLEIEDYVIQGQDEVSPVKWHLAHTSWFFETFILMPNIPHYRAYNPLFQDLFNSYYQTLGQPFPKPNRGLLSRPTVANVYAYREFVDKAMLNYLSTASLDNFNKSYLLIEMGLNHEQQHQELILMDIKYNLSLNPEAPKYHTPKLTISPFIELAQEQFLPVQGTTTSIGYTDQGFCYDIEKPAHLCIIQPFNIANRLVTNGQYLEFINAKGYQNPSIWLSDGWDCVIKNNWQAPLYWRKLDDQWHEFTLYGLSEIDLNAPVCHISFYEANAYAQWRGLRLPTETEWEHFVTLAQLKICDGNFLESNQLHPVVANKQSPSQFFGDLWEWTMSPYTPYAGYRPYDGTLGEYNGKFMCNKMVLRGGCCVTPRSHIRKTYRNFYQLDKRWQFSGVRLASSIGE